MLKIIFAGTPEIAQEMLSNLILNQQHISQIYTQPDRPAGRGRHLTASPVKMLALEHAIPVLQPDSLKTAEQAELLQQLAPDILVVVAYGLLLPRQILAIPRYGCINVHFSLLPRWRGASPVQQAILAGDPITGISIIQMDAGLDTGPILNTATCDILAHETSEDLFTRLMPIAQNLLLKTLDEIEQHKINPQPQDKTKATYAPLIEKQQAHINWQQSAVEIDRLIRAYYPWPIAYTSFAGQSLRIFKAYVKDEHTKQTPGLILAAHRDGLEIATGQGILCITQAQLPGKRCMPIADLLNARLKELQPGQNFA